MATHFAAYDDFSIYAVAETAEAAIAAAIKDAGDPDAMFVTAKIGAELAAQIERDGWDGNRQSFRIADGCIIDTTND